MPVHDDPDNTLRVSIIIPTLNRANYLRRTLESLVSGSFPPDRFEILIVDGGSTDDTQYLCRRFIEANPGYLIHLLHEPEPGSLAGRHRGAKEASGEILTFIDDDIEAHPGWLPSISDAFRESDVHLVGGKNLPKFEATPPPWLKDFWITTPYGGKECGYLSLLDLGDKLLRVHPDFVWSLNLSIRRETLFDAGGFHPDIYPKRLQRFQGDGETGLTMKLFERGYGALYHPGAAVFHAIPKNRMTIDYFEKRMYFQGVADSYSDIRKSHFSTAKDPSPPQDVMKQVFEKSVYVAKGSLSKVFAHLKSTKDARAIKEKMEHAYNKGYEFHQAQVRADPTLLKWILKKDYWDYHLRIDLRGDEVGGTLERSY